MPTKLKIAIIETSISKTAKKDRSPRAQFYSALMTNLGGATGDKLGEAFTANDHDKFQKLMLDLSDKMAKIETQ